MATYCRANFPSVCWDVACVGDLGQHVGDERKEGLFSSNNDHALYSSLIHDDGHCKMHISLQVNPI